MNRLIFILIIAFSLYSCKSSQQISSTPSDIERLSVESDTISLTIEAINLSEDMSRLSSKNDELLILIYKGNDKDALDEFVFAQQLVLDESHRQGAFKFSIEESSDIQNERWLMILIEQDSDTPIEQIDPIFRVHHLAIADAYNERNYIEIEKYLGDEDVLGIKYFSPNKVQEFTFSGIHKLDRFEFRVVIE